MSDFDQIEKNITNNNGLGCVQILGLSAMACYPFPYLPICWEALFKRSSSRLEIPPFSEELLTRETKKFRRNPSFSDSISSGGAATCGSGISRSGSVNNLPKEAGSEVASPMRFRDHILTYTERYLEAEAVQAALEGRDGGGGENEAGVDEMRLVHGLIACAEAVACRDRAYATALLQGELRVNALALGSAFQRVASCFVQGLADRLAKVNPLGAVGFSGPPSPSGAGERDEALRLVYEACPYIRFGHHVANRSFLEAFERESRLHVIDLGMSLGLPCGSQWRDLITSLAARRGGADQQPVDRLRITAVGLEAERFHAIGDGLWAHANKLGINLEFDVVKTSLENLNTKDIVRSENEVLVVNSVFELHCVVKESRGALNSVLQTIHELSPKVMVLVEQDSSHNGPFFLGRFMEALHYYSAIFDSLDAKFPKYDTKRAKIEQFYFAEEIKNIISCEGPARVERHERVDQWRRRMSRAGFQASPIKMAAQARLWLDKSEATEGYTVVEEKGCLVLGWKARPIVAVSRWKC